jgi:putative dimethyl sulfoxide reductase chaperone
MMSKAEHIQWEEARGALYGFFSQAFIQGPSPKFLKALISEAGTMNLSEIFPDTAYRQELAQVRLDAREGRLTLETAALDFEALFRVPGSRYLSPYESVYRSEGAGGRGCLCGPEAVAVERLYLQEGLGPKGEFSELPDHVGVELEFMAILCRKAVAAMQADDAAGAQEYQHQQYCFFMEHLAPWVRVLAERLASQAQTSLYRFLGNFLDLFLGLEADLQFQPPGGQPQDVSQHQGAGQ